MSTVETVRGEVDLAAMGRTLMHEHVFCLDTEMRRNTLGWDEEVEVANAIEKLKEVKAAGFDTLVDCTAIGLGRYIPRIQRIAAEIDLQLVVATGLYTYDDVPMYYMYQGPGTLTGGEEGMVPLFVQEITEGIADTGVKAAVIKCATDEKGVTPGIERILRACAQAHRLTGAPITTHTSAPTRRGLEQQEVFASEGVDLTRVIVGHCGDTTDLEYLERILSQGSYIGMDRFGLDVICPLEDRVKTIVTLVERGYVNQILISQDANCATDMLPSEIVKQMMPNWNYLHIANDVLPLLKEQGVSDDQIEQMLVRSPQAIFGHSGGY
jgi:phosphotriesterase-related protein